MSRGRFGLLLALLVLVVGVGAFFGVGALLDDGPTTPEGAAAPEDTSTTAPVSSTTTTTTGEGVIGETPAYVVVVTSAIDEATAQASRDELTDQGFAAGVLDSDDYSSLNPGYYVTFVGPWATSAEATAGRDELVHAGYSISQVYVRCVGTKDECT
jgi:hypothetical protein